MVFFFLFKQKTAYELRISDWSSDVCSSDLLLAACRKEFVEQRCAAIELAGLKPKVVDIETYALENASVFLQHQLPDGGRVRTIAIVDNGAHSTSVLILHDGNTVYTRDNGLGGRRPEERGVGEEKVKTW